MRKENGKGKKNEKGRKKVKDRKGREKEKKIIEIRENKRKFLKFEHFTMFFKKNFLNNKFEEILLKSI